MIAPFIIVVFVYGVGQEKERTYPRGLEIGVG